MKINSQTLGTWTYKCDNCCNKIPTGTEKPRWTNVSTHVYKHLFCRSCERGHELSEPYNIDPKEVKTREIIYNFYFPRRIGKKIEKS